VLVRIKHSAQVRAQSCLEAAGDARCGCFDHQPAGIPRVRIYGLHGKCRRCSCGNVILCRLILVRQSRASRGTWCCSSLSRFVVAKPSIILAITVILASPSATPVALAQGQPKDSDPCSKSYTDDEAKQLTDAARKAVRRGHPRRKDIVLKDLGVDPSRLCNRRQGGANLGYKICWQVSPSYDLTWWLSAFDGPPDDRDDRRISSVRIVQHQSGYWGTQCPMTDEERGPPEKTATK